MSESKEIINHQNESVIDEEPTYKLVDLQEGLKEEEVPHFSRLIEVSYNRKIKKYLTLDQIEHEIRLCEQAIKNNQDRIEKFKPLIDKLKDNELKPIIDEELKREKKVNNVTKKNK
jgi:hypothetical protein